MKKAFSLAVCLAGLIYSMGCPSSGDNSSGAATQVERPSDDAGSVQATTAVENSASDIVAISDGIFDIAGVKLGMTYDDWQAFYPEGSGVTLEGAWVTDGVTGVVSGSPDDPELAPFDSAWFLESRLVGFYSEFEMTQAEFESRVAAIGEEFGKPVNKPPGWALDSSFFDSYQDPKEEWVEYFWQNEKGREVMMAFQMDSEGDSMFSLLNIDLMDGRIEAALMEKLNSGVDPGIGGQPTIEDPASGETNEWVERELQAVPDGEFGFDGVFLGVDSDTLKRRFESLGLTSMGMWVDRDWTGRLDGSPLGGEAFPAEAGWFLEGKLVGFISTVDGSEDGFDEACTHQSELYGEALTNIPNWAQGSEFFAGFDYQGDEEGVAIWCDAASRGMLFVTFDPQEQSITTMLVDVDHYREAMETTNAAIGPQGHTQ